MRNTPKTARRLPDRLRVLQTLTHRETVRVGMADGTTTTTLGPVRLQTGDNSHLAAGKALAHQRAVDAVDARRWFTPWSKVMTVFEESIKDDACFVKEPSHQEAMEMFKAGT